MHSKRYGGGYSGTSPTERPNKPATASHASSRPFWTFIPVFFIVGLMLWVTVTYCQEIIDYERYHFSEADETNRKVVVGLLGMGMWSLVRAVFRRPGTIPRDWHVVYSGSEDLAKTNVVETKNNGSIRTCRRCCSYKPDRSHHCSSCDQCVLKMDHHCPWINNCVGFENHKFFLLFILYIASASVFVVTTAVTKIYHAFDFMTVQGHQRVRENYTWKVVLSMNFVFSYCVACVFAVSLGAFLGFHLKLLATNTTTIELLEKQNRVGGAQQKHLYDIGFAENLVAVLGDRWYLWLIPVYTTKGDGTCFPTRRRNLF